MDSLDWHAGRKTTINLSKNRLTISFEGWRICLSITVDAPSNHADDNIWKLTSSTTYTGHGRLGCRRHVGAFRLQLSCCQEATFWDDCCCCTNSKCQPTAPWRHRRLYLRPEVALDENIYFGPLLWPTLTFFSLCLMELIFSAGIPDCPLGQPLFTGLPVLLLLLLLLRASQHPRSGHYWPYKYCLLVHYCLNKL